MQTFAVAITVLLSIGPFVLYHYVRMLPVAPVCPRCSSTARVRVNESFLASIIPPLALISFGDCTRCGWRGRMRWKWAPKRARFNGS